MSAKRPRPAARPKAAAMPVRVPVDARRIWRGLLFGFGGLALAGGLVWAVALGLPQQAAAAVTVGSSAAGFSVRHVDIEGVARQPRLPIYQEVLRGGTNAMLAVDVGAVRERLLALPWVEDASVERRWPDRIRIRITEKKPAAVWQVHGTLRVVDAEGRTLPVDDVRAFRDLPLLVGDGANAQVAEFQRLNARAPALFGSLVGATWVGGRRWDLKMKSGETISLPEGADAAAALERLAAIDRATPLLGRGFVRLDLRIPDKLVVRVSGEAGAVAKPSASPPGPPTRQEVRI